MNELPHAGTKRSRRDLELNFDEAKDLKDFNIRDLRVPQRQRVAETLLAPEEVEKEEQNTATAEDARRVFVNAEEEEMAAFEREKEE